MMSISWPAVSLPAGGATSIARATRYTLSNGMVALIQRNPSSPTVSIRGDIAVGAMHEPADKTGLAALTSLALMRGTQNRTFHQLVSEMEEHACNVSTSGGMHQSGFSARALVEDLPLVLDILADVLLRPTFPAAEVEKLRAQMLMSLRESEDDTQYQASRLIRSLLYPPDHPYSRMKSGTPETIQHISRDDMIAFQGTYHPASTVIAIVGDVEPQAVIAQLEQVFGGWEPSHQPPSLELPPTPSLDGIRHEHLLMAGKKQADLIWAVPGLKRKDPAYYAAMLANMLLGQLGLGGRLGENIREKQGMAYYTYSSLQADLGAGPWMAYAGINPANVERVRQAILHEVEQFKREGPDEQEFTDVRAYLTGSLVLGLETNSGIAGALLFIERYDLGLDYISRYPQIIGSISREDLIDVARSYLSTEHYALAVAGPASPGAELSQ